MSGPDLQLRAMAGSIVLMQPGAVLMSVTPSTIKALQMSVVLATTWGQVSDEGPWYLWGHNSLNSLYCHLGQLLHPGQAAAEDHVWVHESNPARFCVEVQCLCSHESPHGSLGAGLQLVTLLVFQS